MMPPTHTRTHARVHAHARVHTHTHASSHDVKAFMVAMAAQASSDPDMRIVRMPAAALDPEPHAVSVLDLAHLGRHVGLTRRPRPQETRDLAGACSNGCSHGLD